MISSPIRLLDSPWLDKKGCLDLTHPADDEGEEHTTGLECLETVTEEEISAIPSHILYEELIRSNPDLSDEVRCYSQRLVAKHLNQFEYKRIVESRIELSDCKFLAAHDLHGHEPVKSASIGVDEGTDFQRSSMVPADTPRLFLETKRPVLQVPDHEAEASSSFKKQRSIPQGPFLLAPAALKSQALPTSSCYTPDSFVDRCRNNDASSIIFGPGPGQYLSDNFIEELSPMTEEGVSWFRYDGRGWYGSGVPGV